MQSKHTMIVQPEHMTMAHVETGAWQLAAIIPILFVCSVIVIQAHDL